MFRLLHRCKNVKPSKKDKIKAQPDKQAAPNDLLSEDEESFYFKGLISNFTGRTMFLASKIVSKSC